MNPFAVIIIVFAAAVGLYVGYKNLYTKKNGAEAKATVSRIEEETQTDSDGISSFPHFLYDYTITQLRLSVFTEPKIAKTENVCKYETPKSNNICVSETPIETPLKPPNGVILKPVSNLTVKHFRRKTKKAQDSLKKDYPAPDSIFNSNTPCSGNRYVSMIAKRKAEELHCIKIVLPLWQSTLVLIQLKPFSVKPLRYICTRFALHLHYICATFALHLRYICATFALKALRQDITFCE